MSMVMLTQGRTMILPCNCGLRHGEITQDHDSLYARIHQ